MAHSPAGGSAQGSVQVHVVGARNLANKEWFSKQDPYALLKHGNNSFKTRQTKDCMIALSRLSIAFPDGGTNPAFNEKFTILLIERLREIKISVYNSNKFSDDDYIGSAKVSLERVVSSGYDDRSWTLIPKHGKSCGELDLIMHFANHVASQVHDMKSDNKPDEQETKEEEQTASDYPEQSQGQPVVQRTSKKGGQLSPEKVLEEEVEEAGEEEEEENDEEVDNDEDEEEAE